MGIDKDKSPTTTATKLRRHAEERLCAKMEKLKPSRTMEATERLLHELEVHQIELEMQNAELRHAWDEMEMSLEKYTELFDFAPVGYFTIDPSGTIIAVNISGASLLGIERALLIGRRFDLLVADKARPTFTGFFQKVFTSPAKEACEVKLQREGNSPLFVQIEGLLAPSGEECRVALIDVTGRKQMEERALYFASFPLLNPNPVLEVDSSCKITFANPATQKILKKLGIPEEDVNVFIPPDLNDILRKWDRKDEFTLYREIVLKERVFGESIFLSSHFEVARIFSQDITERRRIENELNESEGRVRQKLESIISPGGDIGNLDLADIIDVAAIQTLMEDFYKLAPMPMAILDLKGKVLVGKGWQDICTKFHRTHPVASRNCLESDLKLTTDILPGEFKLYKCKNHMWDVATPIMVGDVHVGNLFSGQFFFDDEPLDYELFKSQAERYGFDMDKYIAALECVPRLRREFLATGMDFLTKFAAIISKLSYSNIKLARSLTERDALTASLSESELFYRQTLESIPGMVFTTRPDGYCDYQSQQWVDFTGVPMAEHLGDGWNKLLHPDDRPRAFAAWRAAVEERAPYDLEYRVRRLGGEYEWFKVRGRPIRNDAGEIVRWFGTALNINQLLSAQEALRRAHDELEQRVAERTVELADTVETLLGEMSVREKAETNLLRLNRLYSVLGEINQAIVRASDRDSLFSDFCRIAVEQGGFLLSWVGLVDKEMSTPVRSVAAYGAICYLEDIHISANEVPAGAGPTGISIREGTYYICNDFLNDPCTQPWHERGRAHGIKASASVALKEEGRVIGALTLYAGEKDFFDRQQVELLIQMGADVSFALDNMAREGRRQKAEQALQEEILERLRAVEALRENEQMLLQQNRLAAMGEMINNIAHQWRQPLNVLALLVQQIQLFYDSGLLSKEELDSCVNKSMDSIAHMSHTIDDFRNFFRPDKKQVEFKIHDVVMKTVALVEDSFSSQEIRIDLRIHDNPALIGFPNEYSQVLLNILTNARDALLERGQDGAQVTITICKEKEKGVVIIADNAGGIPEGVLGKIFEPYFTTKGPDKGTGVGLFMSKTIIEKNMNGRLTARNTTEGAEFRIEV